MDPIVSLKRNGVQYRVTSNENKMNYDVVINDRHISAQATRIDNKFDTASLDYGNYKAYCKYNDKIYEIHIERPSNNDDIITVSDNINTSYRYKIVIPELSNNPKSTTSNALISDEMSDIVALGAEIDNLNEIAKPTTSNSVVPVKPVTFKFSENNKINRLIAPPLKRKPPAEPVVPAEPSEPTVPAEPSEPTVPAEPAEPSEPTVPAEPAEPTEPSEPAEPTVPAKPTVPTEPVVPAEPSEPTVPAEPAEPVVPAEPAEPSPPIMPVISKDKLNKNDYTFKTYTYNNTDNKIPQSEKDKLRPLYSQPGGWGEWVPSDNGKATYYICEKDEYLGVTSNLNSETRKQQRILQFSNRFYGGTAFNSDIIKHETSGTIILNKLRNSNIFSDLYYYYFNMLNDNTWRWTLDLGNLPKYKSIGWDLLYNIQGKTETINGINMVVNYLPCKTSQNTYLMVHLESKQITIDPISIASERFGFKRIRSTSQNGINNKACGIFVIVNSLLITYLSKYQGNASILNENILISHFVKHIMFMIIKYLQYLYNKKNNIDMELLQTGDIPPTVETILSYNNYDDSINYLREFNGIYDFNSDFHWNIPMYDSIYLNMDWLKTNVIIVENAFSADVPIHCNHILFVIENIKKIKNFYNFNNYTLTFIIGNSGHWKCYTVNKIGDDKQYLFLNSLNQEPEESISNKITELTSYEDYEDYVIKVLECFTFATNIDNYKPYENVVDTMLYALLIERSYKSKIPDYTTFVQKLLTRIIYIDIKDISDKPAKKARCNFLRKIENVLYSSGLQPENPIMIHYYKELIKNKNIYGDNCISLLNENTVLKMMELNVQGGMLVRGGKRLKLRTQSTKPKPKYLLRISRKKK